MAGKLYNIGSIKSRTAKVALKKARVLHPGKGVSVKLYAKGVGKEMSTYTVRAPRGSITGRKG